MKIQITISCNPEQVGYLLALIKLNHLEVDFSALQDPQQLPHLEPKALPPPRPKRPLQHRVKDAKAPLPRVGKPRVNRITGVSVICDALKDGPLRLADLRLALLACSLKDTGVSGRIYDAQKQGLIKRIAKGLYQLVERADRRGDLPAVNEDVVKGMQQLGEMLDNLKSANKKRMRLVSGEG
jgi:hypothetical protein